MRYANPITTKPIHLIAVAVVLAFLSGCRTTGLDEGELMRARFLLEATSENAYSAAVALPLSRVSIAVESEAVLSEYDYASIDLVALELGKCLAFTLKPAAAREFYRISVANQGKRLVLLLNGRPMGARRIDGPIADGRVYMFVEASDEALEEIAEKLRKTNVEIQKKLSR